MNIHVNTLFACDGRSRLLRVNEPGAAAETAPPAPRLFIGRTRGGNLWRFRADLADGLCGELERLCADEPAADPEAREPLKHLQSYARLLEGGAGAGKKSNGLAYHFTRFETPAGRMVTVTENNREVLRGGFDDFLDELPHWQPFVALLVGDRAASVCRSVRVTPEAHEAGVETLPEFRGNGYAREVVSEWARRVRGAGVIPLYSTSWENTSSQAVARKLGLRCYGVTFEVM